MGKQDSIATSAAETTDHLARHHRTATHWNGASAWNQDSRDASTLFAHPAEFDLARILSFYHIHWIYEPTSFQLQLDENGRPIEQVTPDFYLPDYDLYVELTTMRQQLVTRKNRKIRLLKEMHPSVDVKLLYKRDYDRLIGTFPLPDVRNHRYAIDATLWYDREIHERIVSMSTEIASWTTNGEPLKGSAETLLLGLGQGSRTFLRCLHSAIEKILRPIAHDWISFSSYGTDANDRKVRVGRRPTEPIEGREVIVVTDVVSTGLSLAYLTRWLTRRGAASVRICTLLDRTDARIIDIPVDLAGFCAPLELLAGFGISVGKRFADMPHVSIVRRLAPG